MRGFAVAFMLVSSACSGVAGFPDAAPDAPVPDAPVPDAPVPPAISPTTATVAINGSQAFTANTSVTWSVNGTAGGDATVGTIAADGTYTAPAVRPHPITVTVTATAAGGATASATVTITASPVAYVPNGNGIAVWDDFDTNHGNVAPTRVLTGLQTVVGCLVDPVHDRLYVSETGTARLSLFPGAGTLSGATAGMATASATFMTPEGLALDSRNQVWVAVQGQPDVHVVTADTLTPLRSFRDPAYNHLGERRIQLDEARDRLYLIDIGSTSMIIFSGANALDGDATGTVVPTGLINPWGLALDRKRDILYVATNSGYDVAVFEHASTLTAASTPARHITAPADGGNLAELSVDEETDRLAVSSYGAVFVFDNASMAEGTPTPAYSLVGSETTLGGDTYSLCIDWDR